MRKNTSANVDAIFFDEMVSVAGKFDIPLGEIYKKLISYCVNLPEKCISVNILTEYQDHHPVTWKTLHYSLDRSESQFFSMLRFRFKISISKIAFVAFLFFWKVLVYYYKERLKIENKVVNLDSYEDYLLLMAEYIVNYSKKLKMRKKE